MSVLYPQEEEDPTPSPIDLLDTIPDDVLSEILKRLSVKDLLRCRCVQKSWFHLIKTPTFVNLHLDYHHNHNHIIVDADAAAPKLLLFDSPAFDHKLLYIRSDDEQCQEFYNLELPPVMHPEVYANWHAVSSSLICVSTIFDTRTKTNTTDIFLWNPLIQTCKTLPVLDHSHIFFHYWKALAFGYVPCIHDFQVVFIVNDDYKPPGIPPTFFIGVYSLNTNSWKTKTLQDDFNLTIMNELHSLSVNGISCWSVTRRHDRVQTLLCFDSINDVLRNVSLPHQTKDYSLHQLLPFAHSVALFRKEPKLNAFDMWILKQDSKNDFFWEKKLMVTLDNHLHNFVIGTRSNRELIFLSIFRQRGLVTYNPDTHKVNDFVHSWKHWSKLGIDHLSSTSLPFLIHPFVDGLVLLDTDLKSSAGATTASSQSMGVNMFDSRDTDCHHSWGPNSWHDDM